MFTPNVSVYVHDIGTWCYCRRGLTVYSFPSCLRLQDDFFSFEKNEHNTQADTTNSRLGIPGFVQKWRPSSSVLSSRFVLFLCASWINTRRPTHSSLRQSVSLSFRNTISLLWLARERARWRDANVASPWLRCFRLQTTRFTIVFHWPGSSCLRA